MRYFKCLKFHSVDCFCINVSFPLSISQKTLFKRNEDFFVAHYYIAYLLLFLR